MEYRLGNSRRVKSKGDTIDITCPKCNKNGKFGVFTNYDTRLAVKPTLLDIKKVYFLVCPNCASVFTIDEATGKEFSKGRKTIIDAWDLTQLKEF